MAHASDDWMALIRAAPKALETARGAEADALVNWLFETAERFCLGDATCLQYKSRFGTDTEAEHRRLRRLRRVGDGAMWTPAGSAAPGACA